MTRDTHRTIVIFRAEKTGPFKGDVTAVFPTEPGDSSRFSCACYAHVGQHSACNYDWYKTTRPATPDEYADLQAELEGIGYLFTLSRQYRVLDESWRIQNIENGA